MSYTEDLKFFHDERESKEAANKKGEELINWYISAAPFGYYYAAEMLWKKNDQRSMDEAIGYYKKFVEHDDIQEEAHEVKKAIKTVLKAYREGYGSQKEQWSAAHAFEQTLNEKNFKFPPAKKVLTQENINNQAKNNAAFTNVLNTIGAIAALTVIGTAVKKVIDFIMDD